MFDHFAPINGVFSTFAALERLYSGGVTFLINAVSAPVAWAPE
jgi:hypothetical protein